MSEQPEALRLADELKACPTINYKAHAAELRRLHALALDQQCEIYGLNFARATEGKILSLVKAALCEQKRIASNEHAEADRLRSELATLRAQNYETQSLLAGAEAEREALRADAERYQEWKRAFRDGECGLWNALCDANSDAEHDAAIDAALIQRHLIASGYRKCAAGQRTSQFCGQLEQAVLAEREACLDWCAAYAADDGTAQKIEAAIRARREK
jgi:hypothetical protein